MGGGREGFRFLVDASAIFIPASLLHFYEISSFMAPDLLSSVV